MYNNTDLIQILFDKGLFWEDETYQEAEVLLLKFYKLRKKQRHDLIRLIIKGPKNFIRMPETKKTQIESHQCLILEKLKKEKYKIFIDGENYLIKLYKNNPDWKPKPKTSQEILKKKKNIDEMIPEEIINEFLLNKPDDPYINRKAPETIGVKCSKKFSFCKELFELFIPNINHITSSFISPIIWGIRPGENSNEISWSVEEQNQFVKILDNLIEIKSDAEIWNSLPSLFERWQKIMVTIPEEWIVFLYKIAKLLYDFDYKTENMDRPAEWLQRAINHPYGRITEIYIKEAIEEIKMKKIEGRKLNLNINIINFFDYTVSNYANGTRHGLCLISHYLVWLSSIELEWTQNNLYPQFIGDENSEKFLVVWSGYLWSKSISSSLIIEIKWSYLKIIKRFMELGRDERNGLMNHISYIFWTQKAELKYLYIIFANIDDEGRRQLIKNWKNYLENYGDEESLIFWKKILFPLWDWVSTKKYFSAKTHKKLRFEFWHLIKYSDQLFPKVVEFAIKFSPKELEHPGSLKQTLDKVYIEKFPKEYVDLSIALLNASLHPERQEKEWLDQWEKLKILKVRKLKTLKDLLAKNGIL